MKKPCAKAGRCEKVASWQRRQPYLPLVGEASSGCAALGWLHSEDQVASASRKREAIDALERRQSEASAAQWRHANGCRAASPRQRGGGSAGIGGRKGGVEVRLDMSTWVDVDFCRLRCRSGKSTSLPASNGGLGGIGRPELAGSKDQTCVMRVFGRFSFVLAIPVMPE